MVFKCLQKDEPLSKAEKKGRKHDYELRKRYTQQWLSRDESALEMEAPAALSPSHPLIC